MLKFETPKNMQKIGKLAFFKIWNLKVMFNYMASWQLIQKEPLSMALTRSEQVNPRSAATGSA